MQIVCERCGKTGPAASVEASGSVVTVTCGNCGHAMSLGGAPPADAPAKPPESPVSLAPNKCPKCGHRQHDSVACHKCGLVFAKARRGSRPWEEAPPGKEQAVALANKLWKSLEESPTPAKHAAFVDHARESDISAWASMRYRHWMSDHPDDALAQQHMDSVVADAQAIASALSGTGTSTSYAENAKRLRAFLMLILSILLVGIIYLGTQMLGSSATTF